MNKNQAIKKMDRISKLTCNNCNGCCCNICHRNLGYFIRSYPGEEYNSPLANDIYKLGKRADKRYKPSTYSNTLQRFIYDSPSKHPGLTKYVDEAMKRIAKKHGVKWSLKEVKNNNRPEHKLGFCGTTGCTIPREMRSYTCLSFICNKIIDKHFNGDRDKAEKEYHEMTMAILKTNKRN